MLEGVLKAGYKLHVLDWGETVTDLPEYSDMKGVKIRHQEYDKLIGVSGDPSKNRPTVVSVHFLHPNGYWNKKVPNAVVHEIGHTLPQIYMSMSEWRDLERLHVIAKKIGYTKELPFMIYPEEYLPIGLECCIQDKPLEPMSKTFLLGTSGKVISEVQHSLSRDISLLKKYDPELIPVCRQFLKENAVKI